MHCICTAQLHDGVHLLVLSAPVTSCTALNTAASTGARSSELHGCKQSSLPLAGTPSSAYVLIEDRDQQQCATSTPLKAIELQQTGCSKGDAEAVGSTEPTPDCEEGKPLLSDPSVCSGVIQKLNYRILPIFMVMSMLNYIDRTNTAFASLQMNRDLQLSAETYGE